MFMPITNKVSAGCCQVCSRFKTRITVKFLIILAKVLFTEIRKGHRRMGSIVEVTY